MFKAILTALVYGYTIIIMLGMGASIDIDVPAEIKKSPKAILCGVASQYMFMPLITWGLICAFDLGDTEALSLMLCGMSPGGVTSTFFTYVSRANVTLSLLMTTCSTFPGPGHDAAAHFRVRAPAFGRRRRAEDELPRDRRHADRSNDAGGSRLAAAPDAGGRGQGDGDVGDAHRRQILLVAACASWRCWACRWRRVDIKFRASPRQRRGARLTG